MVTPLVQEVLIDGRSWNTVKAHYPSAPSVMSGAEITFGAESCVEHPEPSTANINLWLPKAYPEWMPALGDEVKLVSKLEPVNGQVRYVTAFHGRVDSVLLQDDHEPAPEPYVPVNAAASLHNMTSLTGWRVQYSNGNQPITYVDVPDAYIADGNKVVIPRVEGYHNIQLASPSFSVLPNTKYEIKVGTARLGTDSIYIEELDANSNVIALGTFASDDQVTFYSTRGSTRFLKVGFRSVFLESTDFVWGNVTVSAPYTSLVDPAGYRINIQCSDALAAAGRLRLSDEVWPIEAVINRRVRIANLASQNGVIFASGLNPDQGYYEALDTVVAPRDVDSFSALEAFQLATMASGHTVSSIDNVVQPSYKLLLPTVLDSDGTNAFVEEAVSQYSNAAIPVIPVGAIEDDTFTLDTSNVINQVAIEYQKHNLYEGQFESGYDDPENYEDQTLAFSNASAVKSTPVQRVLKSDLTHFRTYDPVSGPLIEKAQRVLTAQSQPQWRLSNGLRLVLKELPATIGMYDLINEETRFGTLIRIDGAPEFINKYQRVCGGRIVFGAEPSIELELEPVEYSGPLPLTSNSLQGDPIASNITFAELKNITFNDLRTIGAR